MAKNDYSPSENPELIEALISAKFETSEMNKTEDKDNFCVSCKLDNLSMKQVELNHDSCQIFQAIKTCSGTFCYRKEDIDTVYDASCIKIFKVKEESGYLPRSIQSPSIRNMMMKNVCQSCRYPLLNNTDDPNQPQDLYCSIECKEIILTKAMVDMQISSEHEEGPPYNKKRKM